MAAGKGPACYITFFVDQGYGTDTSVAERAQDLGNSLLVGAYAADGVVQLLGVELRQRCHQRDDGVLEVTAQLALQIVDQLLNTTQHECDGAKGPPATCTRSHTDGWVTSKAEDF